MFVFIKKQFNDIYKYGVREFIKKVIIFFKIILKSIFFSPFYFLGFICVIFIRLLKPFILIRIDSVPSNFGDFALWTFNYYAKKELGIDEPKKPYIDLIFIGAKFKSLYNSQILKMWRRKIKIYEKFPLYFIHVINKLLPGYNNHNIKNLSQRPSYGYKYYSNNKQNQIEYLINNSTTIKFTKEEETYGDKLLRELGVENKKKIVCLAVRDHAYSSEKVKDPRADHSYHSYRHTNLDRFKLTAKFLSDSGYYVFRMGKQSNQRFNINDKKVVDYSNSNLKSDFLDVFIGANCYFCISTGYGFDDIPLIFGRPLAIINTPIIGLRSRLSNQIFLTKHHFCTEKNENLTLDEIFKKDVHSLFYSENYTEKGVALKDNSDEEIRDLAKEMIENLKSGFKKCSESNLQIKFKKKFLEHLAKIDIKNSQKFYQTEFRGRFSKYFLEKNKSWLN